MLFSTRTLGLLNTCARVGRIFDDYSSEYSTIIQVNIRRLFFYLFRTILKARLDALNYQSVSAEILHLIFPPLKTGFYGTKTNATWSARKASLLKPTKPNNRFYKYYILNISSILFTHKRTGRRNRPILFRRNTLSHLSLNAN